MADEPRPASDDKLQFIPPQQPLTMEVVPRHLRMYQLSEIELDAVASGDNSLNLAFFGGCFGAFASFASVVFSGSVPDSGKFAVCVTLMVAFGILAAFFGIRGFMDGRKSNRKIRELKHGRVINTQ
jgi:hypothetical protein